MTKFNCSNEVFIKIEKNKIFITFPSQKKKDQSFCLLSGYRNKAISGDIGKKDKDLKITNNPDETTLVLEGSLLGINDLYSKINPDKKNFR